MSHISNSISQASKRLAKGGSMVLMVAAVLSVGAIALVASAKMKVTMSQLIVISEAFFIFAVWAGIAAWGIRMKKRMHLRLTRDAERSKMRIPLLREAYGLQRAEKNAAVNCYRETMAEIDERFLDTGDIDSYNACAQTAREIYEEAIELADLNANLVTSHAFGQTSADGEWRQQVLTRLQYLRQSARAQYEAQVQAAEIDYQVVQDWQAYARALASARQCLMAAQEEIAALRGDLFAGGNPAALPSLDVAQSEAS